VIIRRFGSCENISGALFYGLFGVASVCEKLIGIFGIGGKPPMTASQ
jgi:hypothetical protein